MANPGVAAISQELQHSYDELLQTIDGTLAALPSEKLYTRTGPDEWTIMENLAHVAEFLPYWAQQFDLLKAEPGRNFGRTIESEERLEAIRVHGSDGLAQVRAAITSGYERVQQTLAGVTDPDLEITGKHSRQGERTFGWFFGEMLPKHIAAHRRQILAYVEVL